MKNKIILGDNKLWKNTHSVLLHIFCRGILNAESSKLIMGSVISILATPTTWPIVIIKRFVHLIILLILWVLFADFVAEFADTKIFLLALALLAIFYRDIYQEITEIIVFLLILVSAGGILRWICQGYLNNAPLRQQWLTSLEIEPVIASLIPSLPSTYNTEYNNVMNLYLQSNEGNNEQELNKVITQYWGKNV